MSELRVMSDATGIAQLMVGAGWWPAPGDFSYALDVVVSVERTAEDEVAVTVRGLGEDVQAGTIYLTPEMALSLAEFLQRAATVPPGGATTVQAD